MKNYKLDPAWCHTAPGLALDAALTYTCVKLELLSDTDMLLMVKRGISTKWHRNIAENFNRLSMVHERYRQTTDGRTTTYSERDVHVR